MINWFPWKCPPSCKQRAAIEHFHVTSSPLRLRRKTENSHHVGVQQDRSFYGDLHEMCDIPIMLLIRESVDSVCWDGADVQYLIKQKPYKFTTNTLKAYLSVQAFSLSGFVISKTHISGQKPRRRQLNAKVYGSKSAIFRILLSC